MGLSIFFSIRAVLQAFRRLSCNRFQHVYCTLSCYHLGVCDSFLQFISVCISFLSCDIPGAFYLVFIFISLIDPLHFWAIIPYLGNDVGDEQMYFCFQISLSRNSYSLALHGFRQFVGLLTTLFPVFPGYCYSWISFITGNTYPYTPLFMLFSLLTVHIFFIVRAERSPRLTSCLSKTNWYHALTYNSLKSKPSWV